MKRLIIVIVISVLIISCLFILINKQREMYLDVLHIKLDSIEQIIDIQDTLVQPVLYDSLIIQKFVSSELKKQQFINQVLPAILIAKYHIEKNSKHVENVINDLSAGKKVKESDLYLIDSLMQKYQAETHELLLIKLKLHPTSLVLAQAALESGWGSSRFAIEGNNLFGMRSLSSDPEKIKSRIGGANKIYLKKYDNIFESIDHYFLTLGRSNAYHKFRHKRYEEADVYELIKTLNKYSEKGSEYGKMLVKMIEWNDLQKYDSYVIDPAYIKRESNSEVIKRMINK